MRSVFRYLEIHVSFGCTDFVLYRWHMVLDTLLSTGSGNSLSPVNSQITIEPYEHIFENTKPWNKENQFEYTDYETVSILSDLDVSIAIDYTL